jgi:8-oxo-dGTP pyrophosphatase MutT (NUDIX family)
MSEQRLCGGAVLLSPESYPILQLRDDKPGINHPGMLHVFGGAAESSESGREAMVRELGEETGLSPKRLEAAKYLCTLAESGCADGIENRVEIYVLPGVKLDEIEILEGAGVVLMNNNEQLRKYKVSQLGLEVLDLLVSV